MHVPGSRVGHRTAALVIVLHPYRTGLGRRQRGMVAAAALDGGLLIGRDHILVVGQQLALPLARVQVQHPGGLGLEVGARGKIQLRCDQGLMASAASQRQIVVPEISATRPRAMTSARMSGTKRGRQGLGSSQAMALTWMAT
jgi:hypothetical protein